MSQATFSNEPLTTTWTAADLVERFGPIPLSRIRFNPPPGTATEEDVVEIHDREDRLYELIDGVLVEKVMGFPESFIAANLIILLGYFVRQNKLGIVVAPDGLMRLMPGLVRIPDVAFISLDRLSDHEVLRDAIADFAPDLAVEIISPGNTRKEMQDKLRDYFDAGARQVWYVYPKTREVHVYTAVERVQVLAEQDTLGGGDLLPGFSLPIAELFALPQPPDLPT